MTKTIGTNDMIYLDELGEEQIMENLRARYLAKVVYVFQASPLIIDLYGLYSSRNEPIPATLHLRE